MTNTGITTTPRPPGPSLRLSLVLVIAGLALAIPTLIAGIAPIIRTVTTSNRYTVPGEIRVHLNRGNYMVFEHSGSNSGDSVFGNDGTSTLGPENVTVTSREGVSVPVRSRGSIRETLDNHGDRFEGVARFTTPAEGDYTIEVRNASPTTVLIAHPITDTIRSALGWFALAGLGGTSFVVGIVLLIVGSVRRGRVHNAMAYAPTVPAGWHPDPSGSGRLRYWDGYRWTEHLQ
jgi:hypothetical protein